MTNTYNYAYSYSMAYKKTFEVPLIATTCALIACIVLIQTVHKTSLTRSENPLHLYYFNEQRGYSFRYPESETLYECPDNSCQALSSSTIRVDSFQLKKHTLLEEDFFCAADGPQGSVTCVNHSADTFENSHGFVGVKVVRQKIINNQAFDDHVYVFQLPSSHLILSVEVPTSESLSLLDQVTDSVVLDQDE